MKGMVIFKSPKQFIFSDCGPRCLWMSRFRVFLKLLISIAGGTQQGDKLLFQPTLRKTKRVTISSTLPLSFPSFHLSVFSPVTLVIVFVLCYNKSKAFNYLKLKWCQYLKWLVHCRLLVFGGECHFAKLCLVFLEGDNDIASFLLLLFITPELPVIVSPKAKSFILKGTIDVHAIMHLQVTSKALKSFTFTHTTA